MSKKRQLNLENLARLRKAVEDGGPERFIMSDAKHKRPCGTAYCFAGRIEKLTRDDENPEKWLGISRRTLCNLFWYVPSQYPNWTRKERFEWALHRLDELKEKTRLRQLPLNHAHLSRGI